MGLKVDIILVSGIGLAVAAKDATKTIPIVMTGAGDPVKSGLIESLARPGGNITGHIISRANYQKARAAQGALPKLARVGVLRPGSPSCRRAQRPQWRLCAGVHCSAEIRDADDFEKVFGAPSRSRRAHYDDRRAALLAARKRIVELAVK